MIASALGLTIFIILSTILQVSFIPVPLGLAAILIWYLRFGTKYLIWLVLAFSILLATVSNQPAWAILLGTSVSSCLFILGKSFLPDRLAITLGLLLISMFTWEISVFALGKFI